jgi:hypothetical protein
MRRSGFQFVLYAALLPAALAAQPATPALHRLTVDRIVVTVGRTLITLSDVKHAHGFECLMSQASCHPPDEQRLREVASRLIDQALLEQEIQASRLLPAPKGEVERLMAELVEALGGEEAFGKAVRQADLTPEQVQRRLERQATALRFIDLRFRPNAQVEEASIEAYYKDTLLPKLQLEAGQRPPGLDELREQIEEVLVQEKINEEFSAWMGQLREQAQIRFR